LCILESALARAGRQARDEGYWWQEGRRRIWRSDRRCGRRIWREARRQQAVVGRQARQWKKRFAGRQGQWSRAALPENGRAL